MKVLLYIAPLLICDFAHAQFLMNADEAVLRKANNEKLYSEMAIGETAHISLPIMCRINDKLQVFVDEKIDEPMEYLPEIKLKRESKDSFSLIFADRDTPPVNGNLEAIRLLSTVGPCDMYPIHSMMPVMSINGKKSAQELLESK